MATRINVTLPQLVQAEVLSLDHLEDGGLDNIDLEGVVHIDYRFDPVLIDEDDDLYAMPSANRERALPVLAELCDEIPF